MQCKVCKEYYGPEFDDDFIDGECLPCRSQREFEEEQAQELSQLERWNKKFGKELLIDEFYFECPDNIKRKDLKGFPLLRKIWDWMKETRDTEEAEIKYWEEARRQRTLFDDKGHYPF